MSPLPLDWLTARPIAHRGLHDEKLGIVENSIGAALAAIAAGYAIECDVQPARGGDLVVFHDETLERLTGASGPVAARDAAALSAIPLKGSTETIPRFDAFLDAIDGRTPLVVELKSDFSDDVEPARRAAQALSGYDGPVVIESFDPTPIAFLRAQGDTLGITHIPLGIVGEASYDAEDWSMLTAAQRRDMTHFLHYARTRPDFLSWSVRDFPHAIPCLLREGLHIPVTTWTVRGPAQAQAARAWADQIVFEGFAP